MLLSGGPARGSPNDDRISIKLVAEDAVGELQALLPALLTPSARLPQIPPFKSVQESKYVFNGIASLGS